MINKVDFFSFEIFIYIYYLLPIFYLSASTFIIFIYTPIQTRIPTPIQFNEREKKIIDQEIKLFLQKQIIEIINHSEGEYISKTQKRWRK